MKPILIVEDDSNDVLFLRLALEKAGVTTPLFIARDGREALDYLSATGDFADRQKCPLPYLVFLDLKLPRVPGLEVLKWIREQPELHPTVVLVLTSSNASRDVDLAYRLHANAYLVKPSGLDSLVNLVKSVKDFWLSQNQPASTFVSPSF